jgi:hypothetical protein
MPARTAFAILVAALALVAAGCGGESEPALSAGDCEAGKATLPASFPDDLPVPSGLRVRDTRKDGDYTVAEGTAAGSLDEVRDFFQTQLPAAGYELGEGDAEEHEAETEFEGKGVRGKLKIRDNTGCDGRVSLDLAVAGD